MYRINIHYTTNLITWSRLLLQIPQNCFLYIILGSLPLKTNFFSHLTSEKVLKESMQKCFVHLIFRFWSLLATKLQKYTKILLNICLHFARQDGQDGKKRKENHETKVTKIPKAKTRKYVWDERNINWNSYIQQACRNHHPQY